MFKMLLIFAAYFLTARLGLELNSVSGFATLVWAPTGIALAAVILYGFEIWPAIFLAAFSVNLLTGAPLLTALAIGLGNSLEAVAGALILQRLGFKRELESIRDVLLFVVVGAGISTLFSATIGTLSLYLSGIATAENFDQTFVAWWVGDMLGAVIAGSFILSFRQGAFAQKFIKAVLVFGALLLADYLIFFSANLLIYFLFPFLIWVALEFGIFGAALGILLTSIMAIWATVTGLGPFITPDLAQSLLLLQIFMGATSLTILVMAAAITERVRAFESLQKIDKAKSEFVSIASHQLRTPLTTMKWYLEALLTGHRGELRPEQTSYLHEVEVANQKMITLVNTLLNVSRIELGTFKIAPISSVIVRTILNDVIKEFDREIVAKKLEVRTNYTKDTFHVHADPALIRIIFQNLLSNSIKYSPEETLIEVALDRSEKDWHLAVHDQGYGIPKSEQEMIFNKLFRAENAQNIDPDGSGLGLYIVKSVVEQAGGRVWFESELNKGSTFHVALPIIT